MSFDFTVADTLDFASFQKLRPSLLAETRALDCSEANLYASLPAAFPESLPPIAPSESPRAQHRCHVAELFLARFELPESEKPRLSLCEGARGALESLFALFKTRGASVLIPDDVYPVYVRLAQESGVRRAFYSARKGPPSDELLASHQALLLCHPLKPWGGILDFPETLRLESWAQENPAERLIVCDSVYSIDGSGASRRWARNGRALVLRSLSKGWLLPSVAGCAIAPEPWQALLRQAFTARPKNETHLRIAYRALEEHPERPELVAALTETLRERFAERLGTHFPLLRATGYFHVSDLPVSHWLALGFLPLPASAFGSAQLGSVFSVLPPAPAR